MRLSSARMLSLSEARNESVPSPIAGSFSPLEGTVLVISAVASGESAACECYRQPAPKRAGSPPHSASRRDIAERDCASIAPIQIRVAAPPGPDRLASAGVFEPLLPP